MTSFGAVFKVMSKDRFRTATKVIGAEVAVIVVSILWSWVTGNLTGGAFFGLTASWSMPAMLAAFIFLAVANEHVYTRDTYRLIPVGETKLYSANLLSSFVMYLYVGVVQLVLYLVTITIDSDALKGILAGMKAGMESPNFSNADAAKIVFGLLLMSCALILMSWTTISLVHLVVSSTNNFLPNVSRRAVNVVLYVIVIYLVVRVAAFLISKFNSLDSMMSAGTQVQFGMNIVGILVIAAIEIVANIFLLKKWVETIPN